MTGSALGQMRFYNGAAKPLLIIFHHPFRSQREPKRSCFNGEE